MTIHFQKQLGRVKHMAGDLITLVEQSVADAIHAVEKRDINLAKRVIEADTVIDDMEVEVEEECLHTLALHQPVAFDLRYVIAVLKVNNDLERIADHAVSIAQQALFLAQSPPINLADYKIDEMAQIVKQMLTQASQAMLNVDADTADHVVAADDRVDAIHRSMYDRAESSLRAAPELPRQYVYILSLSRQLERIADLCVNISEDVIYVARGQILRHAHG